MEKKNSGVTIIVVILLLVVFACLGWFGNSYYSSLDKNNTNKNTDKKEESDGGVVQLDIDSSLVQLLYNEVSYDLDNPSWYFNQKIYTYDYSVDKDFIVADASEELKMHVIGNIIIGRENNYASSVPDRSDVGRHADLQLGEYDHYYTKNQVEAVYRQLYGKKAKLDTSVVMNTGLFNLLRYAYDSSTERYYSYHVDGGGTTGPGGYTAKLDRAIKSDDTITLYQKVKKFDGEDGSNLAEEFELVYTFNIDIDDYIFVSKVKKTD